MGEPRRGGVEARDPVVPVVNGGYVCHRQAGGAIAEYATATEADHRQVANRVAAHHFEDLAGWPDLPREDADPGPGCAAEVVRRVPWGLKHGAARTRPAQSYLVFPDQNALVIDTRPEDDGGAGFRIVDGLL